MDKFKSLLIFIETAQSNSFAEAARKLNLSPSAVSKAIARLEASSDIVLFKRSSRYIRLTEEGQIYYDRYCQLIDQSAQIEASIRDARAAPTGTLRLSLVPEFSKRYIIPQLAKFRQQFPAIKLIISFSNQAIDPMQAQFDLALRSGIVQDDRLTQHPIGQFRKITCASPHYLKQHGTPKTPTDLQNHSCVQFVCASSQEIQAWQFDGDHKLKKCQLTHTPLFDHFDAVIQSAINDYGIIQAPDYLVKPFIQRRELVEILAPYARSTLIPLSIIYPCKEYLPGRLSAFIQFIERLTASLRESQILAA
jgi:LysR family transcriptional regulator, regulator for bpeEF and oprC